MLDPKASDGEGRGGIPYEMCNSVNIFIYVHIFPE